MKNPALVVLYVIPALVIAFGAYMGIKAGIDYENRDNEQTRENMAEIFGNYLGLPSVAEMEADSLQDLAAERTFATIVMASGTAGFLLPLSLTAIGRSTKNATRELAAELKRQ